MPGLATHPMPSTLAADASPAMRAVADALVAGWWRLLAQEGVAVRDALTLDELLAP